MSDPESRPGHVSRRDFLAAGGLSFVGLSRAEKAAMQRAQQRSGQRSVILVLLNGGASQLETFDPKPNLPATSRGPIKSIPTRVPGVHFSEVFPRLADRADQLTVIRSLHHDYAPTHETGLQLLQTGGTAGPSTGMPPSVGSVASHLLGSRQRMAPYFVVPQRMGATGCPGDKGDGPGLLGAVRAPVAIDESGQVQLTAMEPVAVTEPWESLSPQVRDAYGATPIGRRLQMARQLIERGARFVTVHTCPELVEQRTWDCHGTPQSPGTLFDYRDTLGPQLDRGLAALLDELAARGLLDETLVVCCGEMGRSPQLRDRAARDHWTKCWSALLAGAGAPRGCVIGETDHRGGEVVDRPVHLEALAATVYHSLRIDPNYDPGVELQAWPLGRATPMPEFSA